MGQENEATRRFREARDYLLKHREDYATAYKGYTPPKLDNFNWALDWFDAIAVGNDRPAVWIQEEDGREAKLSFQEMSKRSNQVANWLRGLGVGRGDRFIVMLGNQIELWETVLAAIKLGAVVIPATPALAPMDLQDRIDRGNAKHVIVSSKDTSKFDGVPGDYTRIAIGVPVEGWVDYGEAGTASSDFTPDGPTAATDPLLLYFTSGTTSRPKLVEHTQVSYPVGHLSTMYWIGVGPGDTHLNISSPGWAKHAWSSLFAPWNAEATIYVYNYTRFNAEALLAKMDECQVNTFCAPPTVWRMLIQSDLGTKPATLHEALSAGEPLNPEIIEQVSKAWGLTIRDGYGQTETTLQVGNTPGQRLKPGSMGRPVPGYEIALVDPISGQVGEEGEICLPIANRPIGLMVGYKGDQTLAAEAMKGGFYHTGDVASRDEDGYITYVGRADDVFKASDYRISPFELESVLIEHPAVVEAAVVPSPDPIRLAVPKAYVALAVGVEPNRETALSILGYAKERLSPHKRIRRLEFYELPKTISGKIRRVELRSREKDLHPDGDAKPSTEFRYEDFPELQG